MSEPFDHLLEKYARLVIRVGVNVQPGQEVVVNCLPEQADAARALAEEAYRVGASRVSIDYLDPHLQRSAVVHAPEDELGSSRPDELDRVRAWRETRPAVISLTGNPFPTLMDGLDPERLAKSAPMSLIQEVMPIITTNQVAWTVVGAPTPGWAASVGVADVAALWDAVAVAMRLDEADPEQAWRDHIAKLTARAAVLNGHAFDRVRYRGPGTDVTIGMAPESLWVGGSWRTRTAWSSCRTCPPRRSSSRPTGAAPRAPCGRPRRSSCRRWARSSRTSSSSCTTARSPGAGLSR